MNSEIIIYQTQDNLTKIEVTLDNETVWLTQAQMAELFQTDRTSITKHIKNIYETNELDEFSTCAKIAQVRQEGSRQVERSIEHYNLDVVISVGYRINSLRGTQFRIWATNRLKELIVKGFTLDDDRLKSGNKMNYFNELLERIRDIRSSEKVFYQKVKDIYLTSIDYDKDANTTREFFQVIQNKLHHAIHNRTAAELIKERVDAEKQNLGLTNWKNKRIRKEDVLIAKNYLTEAELQQLNLLVEQYLAFAESQALAKRPMYMKDWIARLDAILQLNELDILHDAGKVSKKIADEIAVKEYEKYNEKQRLIESAESLSELENDIKLIKGKK
jgi:hypothetical protein